MLLVDFRDGQRVWGYVAALGLGIHIEEDTHLGGNGYPLSEYTDKLGYGNTNGH
jgi:hypothetical protein